MCLVPHFVGTGDALVFSVRGAEVRGQGGQRLRLEKIPHSLLPNWPLKSFPLPLRKVLLEERKMYFACVALCGWREGSWDFSTFPTRLPVLSLPNSVSSWHQTQKVMLSGFLPFFPPWFSQKISTDEIILLLLPAPAIMQSICLNYRLQQLFVLLSPLWVKVAETPVESYLILFRREEEGHTTYPPWVHILYTLSLCSFTPARWVRYCQCSHCFYFKILFWIILAIRKRCKDSTVSLYPSPCIP